MNSSLFPHVDAEMARFELGLNETEKATKPQDDPGERGPSCCDRT